MATTDSGKSIVTKPFDFGSNWSEFSLQVLDPKRLQAASESLRARTGLGSLEGKSFLDVGCGSGLFSIAASMLNAEPVLGIDINPGCVKISEQNRDKFIPGSAVHFEQGSALDSSSLKELGVYDIVYAWGSLHHTGSMWEAIRLVSQRVAPGGIYILAIYNKHFTSPLWRWIKWLYNQLPMLGQKLMSIIFGGVIYVAKFLVTRRNPLEKERGMDFWYDVIDWVGGYPYEYASKDEIIEFILPLGFKLYNIMDAQVPTGCNEFVFIRSKM